MVLGIAGVIFIISAYIFTRQYGSGDDDDGKPGQP